MDKRADSYNVGELFQFIFKNSDDWLVILNASFCIKMVNCAFANEFNLSVDESRGLPIKDVLKRLSLDFSLDSCLLSREKTQIIRTQTKQGHPFSWIIHRVFSDKEVNYLLIGRFPSYKEIFNKYLQLETMLEHMPCNVYWMDKELTHLGCNQNVLKMCGVKKNQYVGSTYEDIAKWANWPEGLADSFKGDDLLVLKTGAPTLNVLEKPFLTAQGNVVHLLTSRVPLRDPNGEIIGVGGISTDISDITDLVKSKEKAEAANRSKTEFLANMSHDVKTPLQGVVGMAQLLACNPDVPVNIREQAETIYACGLQVVSFFDSCLELSKIEMSEWAMKVQFFSVRKLMDNLFALFLPTAEKKNLKLTMDCDASIPDRVEGHYDSIYRVLLNLMGNALKFTETGGVSVSVFLGEKALDEKVNIIFTVEDTGIGIPEDNYRVIFEKLSRLTPSYKGSVEGHGIGLYIVDQYVVDIRFGEIRQKNRVSACTVGGR